MALYLITRTDKVGWDQCEGLVVRASSQAAAQRLATGSENSRLYDGIRADGSNISVTEVPTAGDEAVILEAFLHG